MTPDHNAARRARLMDLGLLLLRVGTAALIWAFHIRPKLAHFDDELANFPDPIGVGHAASFALALLSEGACSIALTGPGRWSLDHRLLPKYDALFLRLTTGRAPMTSR